METNRGICPWALKDPLSRAYHDNRWCRLVTDENELFALLVLESFSVGLSWSLILRKEDLIRKNADGLDPKLCASYGEEKVRTLLSLEGMIHHEGKVRSLVTNARAFLSVEREFGSFLAYLRLFTGGKRIDHRIVRTEDLPTVDPISVVLSKDMKKRGFSYLGPTILYSYLQAVGVFDDHLLSCLFHGKV